MQREVILEMHTYAIGESMWAVGAAVGSWKQRLGLTVAGAVTPTFMAILWHCDGDLSPATRSR